MSETTNTNNPELINKIHKEYMYYNTDGFSGKYKKKIFRAGDIIKHLEDRKGDTATSSVKEE